MGRMGELAFDLEQAGYTATRTDQARLTGQLQRVYHLMSDGKWRSLREIAMAVGGSEAGVSARLRDLRKPHCGGHSVSSIRESGGLWSYRLVVNP